MGRGGEGEKGERACLCAGIPGKHEALRFQIEGKIL